METFITFLYNTQDAYTHTYIYMLYVYYMFLHRQEFISVLKLKSVFFSGNLCTPLRCKKKELCLLEDAYTAVCVSKKEIHKNGDVVISREKFMAEETARKKALEEALAEDEDDEDDDDIEEDDDDDDDDIFYDSGISSSLSTNK